MALIPTTLTITQGKRVLELMYLLGYDKQTAFAKAIGTTQGSINHLVNGRKDLVPDFLRLLLKAHPNANLNWLFSGQGEPLLRRIEIKHYNEDGILEKTEVIEQKKVFLSDEERAKIAMEWLSGIESSVKQKPNYKSRKKGSFKKQ